MKKRIGMITFCMMIFSLGSLFAMKKNNADWFKQLLQKQAFSELMPVLYKIFDEGDEEAPSLFKEVKDAADKGSIPMIYLLLRNQAHIYAGKGLFDDKKWKKIFTWCLIFLIRVEQDVAACEDLGLKKSFHWEWDKFKVLFNGWYYKKYCQISLVQSFKFKLLYWFKKPIMTSKIKLSNILDEVQLWFTDQKINELPSPATINACYPAIVTSTYKIVFTSSDTSHLKATHEKDIQGLIIKKRKNVLENLIDKNKGEWRKADTIKNFFSDVISYNEETEEEILKDCEDIELKLQQEQDELKSKKLNFTKKKKDEKQEQQNNNNKSDNDDSDLSNSNLNTEETKELITELDPDFYK